MNEKPDLNPENDFSSIDELFQRSADFKNSKNFLRFFQFIGRMNHYARFNAMLVYIQNPAVTFFGGKSFWHKWKREISCEAKPLMILAPRMPVMMVYDVFDTTGELSPQEFLDQGMGRNIHHVSGALPPNQLQKALAEVARWGIRVRFAPMSYLKSGHIQTGRNQPPQIVLKEGLPDETNFMVLIHELAHLLLEHTAQKEIVREGKGKIMLCFSPRNLDRKTEELEAETVAHLVGAKFGLLNDAAEYLSHYLPPEGVPAQFSYERVVRVADRLEKIMRG